MINQGSNDPITIVCDVIPIDISVTLHNEIEILKHWAKDDLIASEDRLTYTAPISQEESMAWEEGPCEVEVRWVDRSGDNAGIVQTEVLRDYIQYQQDQSVLDTEEAIVTEEQP